RAELLYDTYGLEVVDILMNDPERIANEISGIGMKLVESWSQQIKVLDGNYDLLARLMHWGMTRNQAKRLIKELGQEVDHVIEKNPYTLIRLVKGFGFRRCDQIAKELKFDL